MNIFFKELKSYRLGLVFWSFGMFALIWASMAKYATYSGTGQSIKSLISQFPQSIQTIFGISGFNLDTVRGYFGVIFMYIALMATIHAVLLGAGIISKEERDRTSEFLFTKPISRFKIITSKISAGVVNLVILNLVTFAASIYSVNSLTKGSSITGDISLLMLGLLFLQLLFFFVGTTIAAISRKPKSSASVATSVLLVTFILTYFIDLNANMDNLKYLTPFKYFDARNLLVSGHLDLTFVAISVALLIAMTFMTYGYFQRRDLSV